MSRIRKHIILAFFFLFFTRPRVWFHTHSSHDAHTQFRNTTLFWQKKFDPYIKTGKKNTYTPKWSMLLLVMLLCVAQPCKYSAFGFSHIYFVKRQQDNNMFTFFSFFCLFFFCLFTSLSHVDTHLTIVWFRIASYWRVFPVRGGSSC